MINLNLTPVTRWGLNVLALLGAVLALRWGESVFIPTVIAVLLAALLWPIAGWLHRSLRFPWSVSCLLAVTGLLLLNLGVTLGFTLAITKMLQDIPNPNLQTPDEQQELYSQFRAQMKRVTPEPFIHDYFPEKAEESKIYIYAKESMRGPYIAQILLRLLNYAYDWMWQWVLIMFILLFLLLEGRMLSRRVVEIFGPSQESRERAGAALTDMAHQVRTYLIWRTLINMGMGLLVGVVYYALTLHQAWTWALLTSVLCYIPYLGPIAAGLPPIVDALLSCPSPWYAFGIFCFYVAVITLEGYVIVPVVMGRSMEMNATTVMLACLFWDLVWGTPGLFLAMPLMAAIKTICYHVDELRPWANLMSTTELRLQTESKEVVDPNADATIVMRDVEFKTPVAKRTESKS